MGCRAAKVARELVGCIRQGLIVHVQVIFLALPCFPRMRWRVGRLVGGTYGSTDPADKVLNPGLSINSFAYGEQNGHGEEILILGCNPSVRYASRWMQASYPHAGATSHNRLPSILVHETSAAVLLLLFAEFVSPAFAQIKRFRRRAGFHADGFAFVNIGIRDKNIGTATLSDGSFSIHIPLQYGRTRWPFPWWDTRNGVCRFRIVAVFINRLLSWSNGQLDWNRLQSLPASWSNGVLVSRNSKALLHFTDGSTQQRDIFEIAQLIKLDTVLSRITSVNLHINQARRDSGTFRINFTGMMAAGPPNGSGEEYRTKEEHSGGLVEIRPDGLRCLSEGQVHSCPWVYPDRQEKRSHLLRSQARWFREKFPQDEQPGVPGVCHRIIIASLSPRLWRIRKASNRRSRKKTSKQDRQPSSIPNRCAIRFRFSFACQRNTPKGKAGPFGHLPLDANAYFDQVADAMAGPTRTPSGGVGYKDALLMDSLRNRDYLFPKSGNWEGVSDSGGASGSKVHGNGVDAVCECDVSNGYHEWIIMGHSFGGYFVLFTLLETFQRNSHAFETFFVSASPSLDYAHGICWSSSSKLRMHPAIRKCVGDLRRQWRSRRRRNRYERNRQFPFPHGVAFRGQTGKHPAERRSVSDLRSYGNGASIV